MRRVLLALSLCCIAAPAFAADVPYVPNIPGLVKSQVFIKKIKPLNKVSTRKSAGFVAVAALPKVEPSSISKAPKIQAKLPVAPEKTPDQSSPLAEEAFELPWIFDPLVALVDGGKREGSSSVSGNLATNKAGSQFGPEVAIELAGHIVKTAQSTIRLDVQIGSIYRTVLWNDDDVKSGTFKITLNETTPVGSMPDYFPVSALAFVTQVGEGHVAMISLEKIVFRLGKFRLAATP